MRFPLLAILLFLGFGLAGQSLPGDATTEVPVAYCIVSTGQSNAEGLAQSERYANTQYNYQGIAADWPATRTSQPQYVVDPDSVYIYYKGAAQGAELFLDNGEWQPYVAGGNSRNVTSATNTVLFGVEGPLAQLIQERTHAPVAIIKATFPGVGLLPTSLNVPPGPYNNVARTIAAQAYIQRAVRDWADFMPGYRLKIVNILWWQGETDATLGVTTTDYRTGFDIYQRYVSSVVDGCFVIDQPPAWSIVKLDYNRSANETAINDALEAEANERSYAHYITWHVGKSLQKDELTTAQASPLAKGSPTNASGNDDNDHSCYMAMFGIAETIKYHLISDGLIP